MQPASSIPLEKSPSDKTPRARGLMPRPKSEATSVDIICVVLFLVMYYIRPQEWSSVFSLVHFVQIVMIMSLSTLLIREKSLRFSDLFRTPHDWAIFLFIAWTSVTASAPVGPVASFQSVYPLLMFYLVIVQTLLTVHRMKIFVGWWMSLIIVVAALAILSEFGFDPLGSHDVTVGRMKNRLILRLSIFDNPNALGHSVVPAMTMIYFFLIWKRPLILKQVGWGIMAIPVACIFMTVSKGAFVAAGITLIATLTFGRPRWVQIAIISLSIAFGGAVMYKLPRMTELNKSKSDPAIQGRVAAFTHGYIVMKRLWRGVGHGNWMQSFFSVHHYYKAAHSSYVQTGAELGIPGFFLFFLIFYCDLRTLIMAKTRTVEEERLRRTLFVLVITYMVSSWMVDFGFRPTLFMFSAAIAAFHRHLYGMNIEKEEQERKMARLLPAQRPLPFQRPLHSPALAPTAHSPPLPLAAARPAPRWQGRFLPATASAVAPADGTTDVAARTMVLAPAEPTAAPRRWSPPWQATAASVAEEPAPAATGRYWNRIGLIDLAITLVLTKGAEKFWAYLITRM